MLRLIAVPVGLGVLALLVFTFASTRASMLNLALRAGQEPSAGSINIRPAAAAQLGHAPLHARSYLALGLAADRGGEPDRAEALVTRAVRLDPRLSPGRLWLATRYLSSGRIEEGVAEADTLLALNRSLGPQLTAILVEVSRDPRGRRLVAERLADSPEILQLAGIAAQAGFGSRALREMLAPTDLEAVPDGRKRAQSILIASLLKEERYQEARRTWYSLAGLQPAGAVFDGSFEGLDGAAPFAWSLTNNQDVEALVRKGAGPSGSGAVTIQTFGSLPAKVAEQTVVLQPGRHELHFAAASGDGEVDTGDRAFYWTVRCRSGALLLEAFISPASRWSEQSHGFDVPSDCPIQTLTLHKNSTDDERSRALRLSRVELRS